MWIHPLARILLYSPQSHERLSYWVLVLSLLLGSANFELSEIVSDGLDSFQVTSPAGKMSYLSVYLSSLYFASIL